MQKSISQVFLIEFQCHYNLFRPLPHTWHDWNIIIASVDCKLEMMLTMVSLSVNPREGMDIVAPHFFIFHTLAVYSCHLILSFQVLPYMKSQNLRNMQWAFLLFGGISQENCSKGRIKLLCSAMLQVGNTLTYVCYVVCTVFQAYFSQSLPLLSCRLQCGPFWGHESLM